MGRKGRREFLYLAERRHVLDPGAVHEYGDVMHLEDEEGVLLVLQEVGHVLAQDQNVLLISTLAEMGLSEVVGNAGRVFFEELVLVGVVLDQVPEVAEGVHVGLHFDDLDEGSLGLHLISIIAIYSHGRPDICRVNLGGFGKEGFICWHNEKISCRMFSSSRGGGGSFYCSGSRSG